MVKVEVKNELLERIRKTHKRFSDLDARHTVETALEDFLEMDALLKSRTRLP